MKVQEKINYIADNHFYEWLTTRRAVSDELSDKQGMFCICNKLATGFHESGCRKFQGKVNIETVKRLSHLIKQHD